MQLQYGTPLRVDSPLRRGLLGFYACNESAGPCVFDATQNVNLQINGFGSNNPWGLGIAAGLVLNGAGQRANAIVPAALQTALPVTLAVGFRLFGGNTNNAPLSSIYQVDTSGNVDRIVAIELTSVPGPIFNFGNPLVSLNPLISLAVGTDHVLTASFQSGGTRAYLDGKPSSPAPRRSRIPSPARQRSRLPSSQAVPRPRLRRSSTGPAGGTASFRPRNTSRSDATSRLSATCFSKMRTISWATPHEQSHRLPVDSCAGRRRAE
jgi:hypothetical protein